MGQELEIKGDCIECTANYDSGKHVYIGPALRSEIKSTGDIAITSDHKDLRIKDVSSQRFTSHPCAYPRKLEDGEHLFVKTVETSADSEEVRKAGEACKSKNQTQRVDMSAITQLRFTNCEGVFDFTGLSFDSVIVENESYIVLIANGITTMTITNNCDVDLVVDNIKDLTVKKYSYCQLTSKSVKFLYADCNSRLKATIDEYTEHSRVCADNSSETWIQGALASYYCGTHSKLFVNTKRAAVYHLTNHSQANIFAMDDNGDCIKNEIHKKTFSISRCSKTPVF